MKKLIAMLMAAMMVLSLAACGGLKEVAGSWCLVEFITLIVAWVSATGLHFL